MCNIDTVFTCAVSDAAQCLHICMLFFIVTILFFYFYIYIYKNILFFCLKTVDSESLHKISNVPGLLV